MKDLIKLTVQIKRADILVVFLKASLIQQLRALFRKTPSSGLKFSNSVL